MSAKFVRKGKCNQCGNCCRNIMLSIKKDEPIMSEKQFESVKKWDKFYNHFYISGKDTSGILLFTCKELGDNNKCKVYKFRGLGCRLYPQVNVRYLIKGIKMLDGCGFYFEPNKDFKSFLSNRNLAANRQKHCHY